MKSGKTLTELAIELERQSETKKDFVASTEVLEMTNTGAMVLEGDKSQEFAIADVAPDFSCYFVRMRINQ